MTAPYRLRLDETAFRALVARRVVRASVHHVPIEVVLELPWNRQLAAVVDALAALLPGLPLDPPEAREFLSRRRK